MSFLNNFIILDINPTGSGNFILRENTFSGFKYDVSSGLTPVIIFNFLINFGPNLVNKSLCGMLCK